MHRRALQNLSPAQRTELANLIRSHVTQAVLQEHINWHGQHGPGGTMGPGSGERFLAFHRNYIGKLEDWLTSQGKPQYVPLPYWSPATTVPAEFSHPNRNSNIRVVDVPSWATAAGGTTPDPIFGHTALGRFDSSDELGRALAESGFHADVHGAVGGDMATFNSPRDPIFWPWHAFLDDLWSEWELITTPVVVTPPTVPTPPQGGRLCFIATAAYGSELAPPVQFLREFRDDVVLKSRFREMFEEILEAYYRFSPPIARTMIRHRVFKYIVKYSVVLPFVAATSVVAFIVKFFSEKRQKWSPTNPD